MRKKRYKSEEFIFGIILSLLIGFIVGGLTIGVGIVNTKCVSNTNVTGEHTKVLREVKVDANTTHRYCLPPSK